MFETHQEIRSPGLQVPDALVYGARWTRKYRRLGPLKGAGTENVRLVPVPVRGGWAVFTQESGARVSDDQSV
jgi:hypothetical protein